MSGPSPIQECPGAQQVTNIVCDLIEGTKLFNQLSRTATPQAGERQLPVADVGVDAADGERGGMGHVGLQVLAGAKEGVGRLDHAPFQGRGERKIDNRDQAAFGGDFVPDVGRRGGRVGVVVGLRQMEADPHHCVLGGECPSEAIHAVAERRHVVVSGPEMEMDAVQPVIGVRGWVGDPVNERRRPLWQRVGDGGGEHVLLVGE